MLKELASQADHQTARLLTSGEEEEQTIKETPHQMGPNSHCDLFP